MIDANLKRVASELAGTKVSELVLASDNDDTAVYMVATAEKLYALKHYRGLENTARERLSTERHALELMHWHGIYSVPQWVVANPPYALMNWVDGFVIKEPKERDIDDAAVFLGTLHHISRKTPKDDMPLALDACLSGQMIVDQLEHRVAALMPFTQENPELIQFLSQKFMPVFTRRFMAAKKSYPAFSEMLPADERTLIAADFGFHNIMRTLDGKLYFIDFEYFGWDDPVKLMCDFLLHPATKLSDAMRKNFYGYMVSIYGEAIKQRFAAYFPLFALRWVLMLVDAFIPVAGQEQTHRDSPAGDWNKVKAAQLVKAETLLKTSEEYSFLFN